MSSPPPFHQHVVTVSRHMAGSADGIWREARTRAARPQYALRSLLEAENSSASAFAFDAQKRVLYYQIEAADIPVRAFYATLAIHPAGTRSVDATWTCHFHAKPTLASFVIELLEGTLRKLLTELEQAADASPSSVAV
jgi:hypothetical protein